MSLRQECRRFSMVMKSVQRAMRRWVVSLVWWCFRYTGSEETRIMTIEDFCDLAVRMGTVVELVPLADVPYVRSRGIAIAALLPELPPLDGENVPAYREGVCSESYEERVLPAYLRAIEVAAPGERVIVFFGVEPGGAARADELFERAVDRLKIITENAAKKGVMLVVEHLNDKGTPGDGNCMRGHTNYVGSDLHWVVKVIQAVRSPFCKLLFDCYHVEIMHPGKVVELLPQYAEEIGHVHFAQFVNMLKRRLELDAEGGTIDHLAVAKALDSFYTGAGGLEYVLSDEITPVEGIEASLAEFFT